MPKFIIIVLLFSSIHRCFHSISTSVSSPSHVQAQDWVKWGQSWVQTKVTRDQDWKWKTIIFLSKVIPSCLLEEDRTPRAFTGPTLSWTIVLHTLKRPYLARPLLMTRASPTWNANNPRLSLNQYTRSLMITAWTLHYSSTPSHYISLPALM